MKKLVKFMRKNNLQLETVAMALKVSTGTLHAWTVGRAKPSIVNAINLEKLTGGFVTVYDWK